MTPFRPTFVPNLEDDLHCLQAAFIMAIESQTGKVFSMDDAERLTGFVPGLPTWPFEMMLSAVNQGIRVTNIELFDPHEFCSDPIGVIRRQSGDGEVSDSIVAVTDAETESERVERLIESSNMEWEVRIPELGDIERHVRRGDAVIVNVNALRLNNRPGYSGHFVVVHGLDDQHVYFADPGLPPREEGVVDLGTWLAAWNDPGPEVANVVALSVGGR